MQTKYWMHSLKGHLLLTFDTALQCYVLQKLIRRVFKFCKKKMLINVSTSSLPFQNMDANAQYCTITIANTRYWQRFVTYVIPKHFRETNIFPYILCHVCRRLTWVHKNCVPYVIWISVNGKLMCRPGRVPQNYRWDTYDNILIAADMLIWGQKRKWHEDKSYVYP